MTSDDTTSAIPDAGEASVGVWLRSAREAAGMSLDTVAQQLKLAPRQVRAIEEDDFAHLPGRTFVRGFVRNYARLVNLDPAAVVAALPSGEATSPLERLTYTPGSRPMGEIPTESSRRSGAARWIIPLLLVAVIAVAGVYEYRRSQSVAKPAPADGVLPPAMTPPVAQPVPANPSGSTSTPLPNPLEAPKSEAPPAPVAAVKPDAAPPAAAGAPATVNVAAAPAAAAGATTSESPLLLDFKGTSWVQVKDATGAIVVSQTAPAGTMLPVGGTPPWDVVIGNVENVKVQFRGQPMDLGPYTHYNVARLVIK